MSRLALPLKTYTHLAAARKVPSEYEIVTSRLLYYVDRGFEVAAPVAAFYQRHQKGSPLTCSDWESFRDPRETTYTRYTALQAQQETHVDALFRTLGRSGHGACPELLALYERTLGPARFAVSALHMLAAYVGQMAPASRITIAATFQAADETRRIHRFAYRLGQLRRQQPDVAQGSRDVWQGAPEWQPLRRLMERALTTYDWGEALVLLNLCLKPVVDHLFLGELGHCARTLGDHTFAEVLRSLEEDSEWHREWTRALLAAAFTDRPENRKVVDHWVQRWMPEAQAAGRALAGVWNGGDALVSRIQAAADGFAGAVLASGEGTLP